METLHFTSSSLQFLKAQKTAGNGHQRRSLTANPGRTNPGRRGGRPRSQLPQSSVHPWHASARHPPGAVCVASSGPASCCGDPGPQDVFLFPVSVPAVSCSAFRGCRVRRSRVALHAFSRARRVPPRASSSARLAPWLSHPQLRPPASLRWCWRFSPVRP